MEKLRRQESISLTSSIRLLHKLMIRFCDSLVKMQIIKITLK
ncbi:hypothetical protein [Butyrivibrio sp.]|nr:hypothetical protein [Butyrivibrio sp.]